MISSWNDAGSFLTSFFVGGSSVKGRPGLARGVRGEEEEAGGEGEEEGRQEEEERRGRGGEEEEGQLGVQGARKEGQGLRRERVPRVVVVRGGEREKNALVERLRVSGCIVYA